MKISCNAGGDFLEVRFSETAGFMRETNHDAVTEQVGEEGNVLGFSIILASRLAKEKPLVV